MTDVLGWRTRIGVLVPSTNTILEPELYAMAPQGVTCHVSRMYVPPASVGSAAEVENFINNIRAATDLAVRDVLTLEPDYLAPPHRGRVTGYAAHRAPRSRLE